MSRFGIGAMDQFGNGMEKAGYVAGDITKLRNYRMLAKVKQVLDGHAQIVPVEPDTGPALELFNVVDLPKQTEKFVWPKELATRTWRPQPWWRRRKYETYRRWNEGVHICEVWKSFGDNFMKKIEKPSALSWSLRCYRVRRREGASQILADLGGKAAEVTLFQLHFLLESDRKQNDRDKVLSRSRHNYFPIHNHEGGKCIVDVFWCQHEGWHFQTFDSLSFTMNDLSEGNHIFIQSLI